ILRGGPDVRQDPRNYVVLQFRIQHRRGLRRRGRATETRPPGTPARPRRRPGRRWTTKLLSSAFHLTRDRRAWKVGPPQPHRSDMTPVTSMWRQRTTLTDGVDIRSVMGSPPLLTPQQLP